MELERIPWPMEHREAQVLCLGTRSDAGCGHPVDWHTGQGTVAPDCDCCSWRKNDPEVLVQGPAAEPVPPPKVRDAIPDWKWAMMNRRERRAAVRRGRRK